MPFRVTSRNWQESDRFLAGIMTAFGAPTRAIPIDGVGKFEGVMLGAFRRPRIEGRFTGSEMRAWDVNWGEVDGDFVVENSYANISRAVIAADLSRMDVTGQFSLGYPRADGGEQIDARMRVTERPVGRFPRSVRSAGLRRRRHVVGRLSRLRRLRGPARLRQHDDRARHRLRRAVLGSDRVAAVRGRRRAPQRHRDEEGRRHRERRRLRRLGGTYSFDVAGRGIAVDTLTLTAYPGYPTLYGSLDFTANGSGTFEEPRYDVKWGVSDLFFGDEGIGEMTGRLSMRGLLMTYEMEAASPRLAVSGTGRIELNDEMDAELSFRVTDTSLDPYLRAMQPTFSPFTSAIASGTIRVVGELYNPDALRIDTDIEQVNVALLDYRLRNPRRFAERRAPGAAGRCAEDGRRRHRARSERFGEPERSIAGLQANGAANLAVLQGFLPDIRSSGRAEVTARIAGTAAAPIVAGNALLSNGRMRQLSFPHALEDVNGIATFDAEGLRLDGITARLGGGAVRFGGRIGLSGYQLSEFDVTAAGEDMNLRYPEGMRSLVDAELALQGPATAPIVTGTVTSRARVGPAGSAHQAGSSAGSPVATPRCRRSRDRSRRASNVRFDVG